MKAINGLGTLCSSSKSLDEIQYHPLHTVLIIIYHMLVGWVVNGHISPVCEPYTLADLEGSVEDARMIAAKLSHRFANRLSYLRP